MAKGINISLDPPRKRKSWKIKLALYCFLFIAGFAVGYFYDIKVLRDTHFDKEQKRAEIELQNEALEAKIDSLEQVKTEIKERVRIKIKRVEKLTDEELEQFFRERYEQ